MTLLYPRLYLATIIQQIMLTATGCPYVLFVDKDTMPHHLQKKIIYSIHTQSVILGNRQKPQNKTAILFWPIATFSPNILRYKRIISGLSASIRTLLVTFYIL